MIETFRLGAFPGGRTLWDGLDIALGDGEVWVVTGPASCGKTLLLRILRGERRPDAGDVVVGGESLFRGSPATCREFKARCGMVGETFADEPSGVGGRARTVGDLFRLSALACGIPPVERKRREEALLSMVGLAPGDGEGKESGAAAQRALSTLSLSERAKVALAAELLRGPKYLFADMLVSNVGKDGAEMLCALFRALAREGKTVVLAERSMPDRWPAAGAGDATAAGPFVLHRLAGPASPPGDVRVKAEKGGDGVE